MDSAPLRGKAAVVSGGSRGIGRAIAVALADAGADVALTYNNSRSAADEVCNEINTRRGRANAYKTNVADPDQVSVLAESVRSGFGAISIIVNCAGITLDRSFLKMSHTQWHDVLGVNLNGPFYVTQAFLPGLVELGWGRIINVSSIVGQTGNFGQANYAASKGALVALTMTLARELARKNITANVVAPGFIETDMTRDLPAAVIDQVKAATPLGRLGKPKEVAAAVVFLASAAADFITGQVLAVNGGMYM